MKIALIVMTFAVAHAYMMPAASAADFHVSPGGNDANPGTAEKPLPNVARAHEAPPPEFVRLNNKARVAVVAFRRKCPRIRHKDLLTRYRRTKVQAVRKIDSYIAAGPGPIHKGHILEDTVKGVG